MDWSLTPIPQEAHWLAEHPALSVPWHLARTRKVCSASIFEGGHFSCAAPLDDLRRNASPLGDCLGVGHALCCPAGSGTSPWDHLGRHNQTWVSPTRTAGSKRSSVLAFSSFPLFRPCASTELHQELSPPTAALSSVARFPIGRRSVSASGRSCGAVIPERSSP